MYKQVIFMSIALIVLIILIKKTKKYKYKPVGKAKYSHTNDFWREIPHAETLPTIEYRPYYNASNKQMYRFPQIHWMRANKN